MFVINEAVSVHYFGDTSISSRNIDNIDPTFGMSRFAGFEHRYMSGLSIFRVGVGVRSEQSNNIFWVHDLS